MRTARALLAILLLVSAGLFTVGVLIERSDEDTHNGEAAEVVRDEGEHAEGEASEAAEGPEQSGEAEEKVLGVDAESPGLVAVAVAVSVALAAAVWFRPLRIVVLLALLFGLAAALFDVAEVAHQLDEDRRGLAVLAGVVAAAHLLVAAVSAFVLRQSPVPVGESARG